MMGYPHNACQFIVDGTFQAPNAPQIDTQGTYCDLTMSCIQNCRTVNGQTSNVISRMPLYTTPGQNEIVYPSGSTGLIAPLLQASIPYCISEYEVHFINQFGREVVFMMGNAILEVEIMDLER